jgi:Rap1a immunity proteins
MRLRMLVLAAGLLWPVSSFSQGPGQEYFFKTGNVLLENCSAPPSSAPYIACFSYIAGVADALSMVRFACTPLNANELQTIDVVLESLHSVRRAIPMPLLRTTRRVAPTDAGRVFLERARQILGDFDDAENAARGVDSLRCNLPIELLGPFRGLCLCLAKLRFPTAETGASGDRLECRVNGRESRAHLALLRPLSRQVGETGNAPTRITSTTPASRLM